MSEDRRGIRSAVIAIIITQHRKGVHRIPFVVVIVVKGRDASTLGYVARRGGGGRGAGLV